MPLYATAADWTDGPAPANADQLLRAASILVRAATRTVVYRVTSDGLPADTDVRDAFRDATVTQAQAWAAQGIDPDNPHAGKRVAQSKSIGSASVTYADAAQLAAVRDTTARTLTYQAAAILTDAGLVTGRPLVTG